MINKKLRTKLERFALKHKVVLEEKGEVGFGHPCVGFTSGNRYIDYNPRVGDEFEPVEELYDERHHGIRAEEAYGKHDCLAVLVEYDNYEKALEQLGKWIDKLEEIGMEVVEYETGAKGLQILFSGFIGKAIKLKVEEEEE